MPITERAWIGSDVDDVMGYVRGMPMIRSLAASLNDRALTERVLAAIADQYAARQRADGVWVRAADSRACEARRHVWLRPADRRHRTRAA